MRRSLKVGVVGASASGGWARESHVPAIRALDGLELYAVLGRDQGSAEEAARAFGATAAYSRPEDLFEDHSVDIVTVAVRVPDHHSLVLGSLKTGKHVYCEWPLSPTSEQAEELAAAAAFAGTKVAIGLQARANPAVIAARSELEGGSIGEVLAIRSLSTSFAWGPTTTSDYSFAEDPAAGVNLVFVQGAHTIDLMMQMAGQLKSFSALATRQYPKVKIEGENRSVERRTYDHLIVQGNVEGRATLTAEIIGGRPKEDTPFEIVVLGSSGELSLSGGAPRGFQSGTLSLRINRKSSPVKAPNLDLPETAVNVAGIYERLRDDIWNGTNTAPSFDEAVQLTRLMEDLITTSEQRTWNEWSTRRQ